MMISSYSYDSCLAVALLAESTCVTSIAHDVQNSYVL